MVRFTVAVPLIFFSAYLLATQDEASTQALPLH